MSEKKFLDQNGLDYFWEKIKSKFISSFNGRTGDVMPQTGDYTAEMVGAAPVGFGLGGGSSPNYCNRPDEIKENGFFRTNALENVFGSIFNGWSFGYHLEDVADGTNTYPAYQLFINQNGYCLIQRFRRNGVWSPFEWLNPPMQLGVEYRTAKIINSKPVYAQLVNWGSLPNNTTKSGSLGITGLDGIVSCQLQFANLSDLIPWDSPTTDRSVKVNHISPYNLGTISVTTSYDASGAQMWANIEYTKSS